MKLTRVTGVVVVVVVAVLAVGAYAFAQSSSEAPWAHGRGPGAEHGWGGWHGDGRGPDPDRVREFRADLAGDLAAELDTSAEDVEDAFRAVVAARLEQAVEAGDIEPAQADDALAAYDDGDVRGLFHLLKR